MSPIVPGGSDVLVSGYKRPTVMIMQPMYLKGVELPAGTLLAKEDDGYLMMRVTSFAFDRSTAQEAFGSQESANLEHSYGIRRDAIHEAMNTTELSV